MISTFQALAVALLALLPGASYTFAYERVVGNFGASLADRLVRFLAASALFLALYSGPGLLLYQHVVLTGSLKRGDLNWVLLEAGALVYVLLPTLIGSVVGYGYRHDWKLVRFATSGNLEPRAWDYLWTRRSVGVVRMKLKSGTWLAGVFGTAGDVESFAGGYPEPGDLFLSSQLMVDPEDGSWTVDEDGRPKPVDPQSGLLLRWEEIEFLEFQEKPEA